MLGKSWGSWRRRILPLFCLTSTSAVIASLITAHTLFAQDCGSILKDADNKFDLGKLEEAIGLADSCLSKGADKDERIRIYELQALAYIAMDNLTKAGETAENLIKLNPGFRPNPAKDPLLFMQMIDHEKSEFRKGRRWKRWLFIGGGGIVSAGTLAIILLKEEKPSRLPDPPDFPKNQ